MSVRACWPYKGAEDKECNNGTRREADGNRGAGMAGANGDITGKSLAKHARTQSQRWCKKRKKGRKD